MEKERRVEVKGYLYEKSKWAGIRMQDSESHASERIHQSEGCDPRYWLATAGHCRPLGVIGRMPQAENTTDLTWSSLIQSPITPKHVNQFPKKITEHSQR